ncbi:hypothetical protein PPYR_09359 [Photinus pyralis]|uniref:Cytochrome P450 n=1 Tax=Photinus pyralis TaxID=7054 RepID=A0A5N4AM30_PHOPY|nr:hypothetical protein PPYR_09359 [Photinus pyralis]
MILLGAVVLLPLLLVLTLWFYYYFHSERYLKNVPGPSALPIIGNIHQVGATEDALQTMVQFQKKYGRIFKMRTMFDVPSIVTSDPKLIEEILKSYQLLHKGVAYDFMHSWLGTGLLTSADEKWKKHRRMLTPAFHFKILEGFIDSFNQMGEILLKNLEREVGKPSFNVYPYIALYTLDVICSSSMGTNINAQEDSNSEYVHNVNEICRIISERSLSLLKSIPFLYTFTSDYKAERQVLEKLHQFTDSVIANRKKELLESNTDQDDEDSDFGIKKRLSFLDAMLKFKEDGKGISDEEIREEVDTFMFEGYDTTSSGITSILYCLSIYPEVQESVVEELNSILDSKSSEVNYQQLQEMKYLEVVIKECIRLYPPVPLIARRFGQDTEIDGYLFPKGADFNVFVYGIHRDPSLYPDPEKFDPERFSLENLCKRPPYAYIPFSAGPRNCIGQKYAMLEIKAVVSKILMKFELLPAIPEHTLQLTGFIVLKSKNGIRLRLKDRSF